MALIETYVRGTEITVGVLGNAHGDLQPLPVVEIVPKSAFYDFESKYADGGSEHIIPARLSERVTRQAQALALQCHNLLGCRGMSRTDMLVVGETPVCTGGQHDSRHDPDQPAAAGRRACRHPVCRSCSTVFCTPLWKTVVERRSDTVPSDPPRRPLHRQDARPRVGLRQQAGSHSPWTIAPSPADRRCAPHSASGAVQSLRGSCRRSGRRRAHHAPAAYSAHRVRGAESLPAAEIANVLAAAKLPNGTNFLLAPVNQVAGAGRRAALGPFRRSCIVISRTRSRSR